MAAVVSDISGQLSKTAASSEQQSLQEAQTAAQADLEARQRAEQRKADQELSEEKHRTAREAEAAIDEQYKLVGKGL